MPGSGRVPSGRGAGLTAVVLIHHAGGDAGDWVEVRERLEAASLQVFVPDLPGRGTGGSRPAESIGAMADHVVGLMGAEGIGRAVLAGHSMGGAVALQMVLERPGIAAGLLLASTGARLPVSRALFDLLRERNRGFPQQFISMGFSPSVAPQVPRRWMGNGLPAAPETVLADFAACHRFDVRGRLGEVTAPAVVMVGDDDLMTPVRRAEELAAGIPGARLRRLPRTGHMSLWERPEAFVEEILGLAGAAEAHR